MGRLLTGGLLLGALFFSHHSTAQLSDKDMALIELLLGENSIPASEPAGVVVSEDDGNDNDTGNGTDTGTGTWPSTGNDDLPPTAGYCSNPASARVDCVAGRNLNIWTNASNAVEYTIHPGRILSLPFETSTSSTGSIALQYQSQQNLQITGYYWEQWVSTRPGGSRLSSSVCIAQLYKARYTQKLTQDESNPRACFLGTTASVYYVNYRVVGLEDSEDYYGLPYRFDLDRR